MGRNLGQYIGLIAVGSGAIVLALSYLGAYLLGHGRGRRDEQRTLAEGGVDVNQRMAAMESSLRGLSQSLDRLMDAQRLLVAQQDHLSRKVSSPDRQLGFGSAKGQNTPA